jgi:hypothetical protein
LFPTFPSSLPCCSVFATNLFSPPKLFLSTVGFVLPFYHRRCRCATANLRLLPPKANGECRILLVGILFAHRRIVSTQEYLLVTIFKTGSTGFSTAQEAHLRMQVIVKHLQDQCENLQLMLLGFLVVQFGEKNA